MSKLHEIDLFLHKKHGKKLEKGDSIQLRHEELMDAFRDDEHKDAIAHLLVAKKTHTKIRKALEEGKGCRISSSEIHGGAINWKSIGKTIQQVAKNPLVKSVAHMAVNALSNYATQNKLVSANDARFAQNMGNNLIDSHLEQAKRDAINSAKSRTNNYIGNYAEQHNLGDVSQVQNSINGLGFARGSKQAFAHMAKARKSLSNPLPKKGSQEAKDRMAHLRSLRKTSGGAINVNWKQVGRVLKPVAKVGLKYAAKGAIGALGTVMADGNPLGGMALNGLVGSYVNNKIDGLGLRNIRGGSMIQLGY